MNHDTATTTDNNSAFENGMSTASGYLDRLFASCADDPKGSIHRAWGVSLIFVILYFVVSMFESECVSCLSAVRRSEEEEDSVVSNVDGC